MWHLLKVVFLIMMVLNLMAMPWSILVIGAILSISGFVLWIRREEYKYDRSLKEMEAS